jgi:hypothetical protein
MSAIRPLSHVRRFKLPFPRAEGACLISWTLELSANYGFSLGANIVPRVACASHSLALATVD